MQSLSEYTKSWVLNDMLRLFDLENINESLWIQDDNLCDYLLHSIEWWYAIRSNFRNRQHHWNLYLAENDSQYCLQSKIGSNLKRKTRYYQEAQSKRKQELNSAWIKDWRTSFLGNNRNSLEIVNTWYRTIHCNECIHEIVQSEPKM
jgi:hypothetical protein